MMTTEAYNPRKSIVVRLDVFHMFLWWLLFLVTVPYICCADEERKVYVVYMGNHGTHHGAESTKMTSKHLGILNSVVPAQSRQNVSDLLIHSYKRSFSGFSAYLTEQEATKLAGVNDVVSVFPSKSYNKIIGARYYKGNRIAWAPGKESEYLSSPRDWNGHGTHTAATAAGREVVGASMYGLAEGVARGGVPSARIAVYKACWSYERPPCASEDILAAFDDAIADGVDLILAAVSGFPYTEYFRDAVAIGSFHAMQRGILTSAPAGDDKERGYVSNDAPWLLTVAASNIDRQFIEKLVVDDGRSYEAYQLNSFASPKDMLPLIYGGDAPKGDAKFYAELSKYCIPGSLDPKVVRGKIVLCDAFSDQIVRGVMVASAAGYIFPGGAGSPCEFDSPNNLPLAAICLGIPQYLEVKNYTRSKNTKGKILQSWAMAFPEAPKVAWFSSKGPNLITKDILKPDVTAPGVSILSAWPPKAKLTISPGDSRSSQYNIVSGTSAASAHAIALAGYVKTHHPTWSPAAIRSALMTTAMEDVSFGPGQELTYGSGQINGRGVLDPGLVYDAHHDDYVRALCNQGYDTQKLRFLTGDLQVCTDTRNGTVWDLNYTSFALVTANKTKPLHATFRRTVTNVGSPRSTYHLIINNPHVDRLEIVVEPKVLSFQSLLEKKSFLVRIRGLGKPFTGSASIVWTDGVHHVRSPILNYSHSITTRFTT